MFLLLAELSSFLGTGQPLPEIDLAFLGLCQRPLGVTSIFFFFPMVLQPLEKTHNLLSFFPVFYVIVSPPSRPGQLGPAEVKCRRRPLFHPRSRVFRSHGNSLFTILSPFERVWTCRLRLPPHSLHLTPLIEFQPLLRRDPAGASLGNRSIPPKENSLI